MTDPPGNGCGRGLRSLLAWSCLGASGMVAGALMESILVAHTALAAFAGAALMISALGLAVSSWGHAAEALQLVGLLSRRSGEGEAELARGSRRTVFLLWLVPATVCAAGGVVLGFFSVKAGFGLVVLANLAAGLFFGLVLRTMVKGGLLGYRDFTGDPP